LVDDGAVYIASREGVRLFRRKNDPVDALPGARWGDVSGHGAYNEPGQAFFTSALRGVPAATAATLWFGEPHEAPALVGRVGQPVPGSPDHRFGGTFRSLYLDDSGRVAFAARAAPADSAATGPVGLWTGTSDDFDLALLEGAPAPGAPDGVLISQFGQVAVNANGTLLLTATLKGAGVSTDSNDALFAGMPGDLRLLVREGDLLEVAPGDVRQVRLIRFTGSGEPQYLEYRLNDNDQVIAAVRFTDGSDAIYRVTVPEPVALPLCSSALLLHPDAADGLPVRPRFVYDAIRHGSPK
jgi:hypothetical protein